MIIQKHCAILLLGMSLGCFAMNRDGIFNDDQLKDVPPIAHYVAGAQKAVSGLLTSLTKVEDRVKVGSDEHCETVSQRGPFTVIKEIHGERGKKIVIDMPAKL